VRRFPVQSLLLVLPALLVAHAQAQEPAARVEQTTARNAGAAPPVAPIPHKQLFGTFPIATRSDEARKLLETSIDQYENVLLDRSVSNAHKAATKDPHLALAFAFWSYAARRGQPSAVALQQARTLAAHATADEQLFANWMIYVQQDDVLPAIGAMNDLLARFPNDKHILYLTGEWLYFQQDYDRSRQMMEKILEIDPNFPPALNMLGYAYIETGDPDPAKAVACLKRYAAAKPNHPNPEDSLGEVLRYAGDDQASLEHYNAALKIVPTFITSQVGLGDTRTLTGDYSGARGEYDKARAMATNSRDRLHAEYQKALIYFWEGHPEQGRRALDALIGEARRQKDSYAQYEAAFGRALLSGDSASELVQLHAVEASLQKPLSAMSEPDRVTSLGYVLREQARIAGLSGLSDAAQEAISKLEHSATLTRDRIVQDSYESARGYVLFNNGDYANAVDGLSSDPHSPLALQQLALAQEKLGDTASAETRTRLKYLRASTVEWYLVTHPASGRAR
jgi:predicted Zn-dependent protease